MSVYEGHIGAALKRFGSEKAQEPLEVISAYSPAGDQAQAIECLHTGITSGMRYQTLSLIHI